MKVKNRFRYMSLLFGLVLMAALLMSLAACDCSDDDDETPVASDTPTPTATQEKPECKGEGETIPVIANPPECCEGLTLIDPKSADILGISGICTANCGDGVCDAETETDYNCPQDCEQEITPTPTQAPVTIEDTMPNLVAAFADIDGTWQVYVSSDVQSLTSMTQGSVYWFYAAKNLSPSWSIPLYRGWNNVVWLGSAGAPGTALTGFTDDIPLVISYNVRTGQSSLYVSSAATKVTTLQKGHTYNTIEQKPGNPLPVWSTFTAAN